jgi:hypothetical protein
MPARHPNASREVKFLVLDDPGRDAVRGRDGKPGRIGAVRDHRLHGTMQLPASIAASSAADSSRGRK